MHSVGVIFFHGPVLWIWPPYWFLFQKASHQRNEKCFTHTTFISLYSLSLYTGRYCTLHQWLHFHPSFASCQPALSPTRIFQPSFSIIKSTHSLFSLHKTSQWAAKEPSLLLIKNISTQCKMYWRFCWCPWWFTFYLRLYTSNFNKISTCILTTMVERLLTSREWLPVTSTSSMHTVLLIHTTATWKKTPHLIEITVKYMWKALTSCWLINIIVLYKCNSLWDWLSQIIKLLVMCFHMSTARGQMFTLDFKTAILLTTDWLIAF